MLRPQFFSHRAARKAVNLIAMLLMSMYALSASAIAHANPIIVWPIQGKVHIMGNGLPSDKVDFVSLLCKYSTFEDEIVRYVTEEGETILERMERREIPHTSSLIVFCQRGECPFKGQLETGGEPVSCIWVVRTPDGATINYPWTPKRVEFEEVYIDIATGAITNDLPVWPGLRTFLAALILAWLVEVPAIFLMLRYIFRPRYEDTKRLLGVGLLATLVTFPLAWYALPFIRLAITLTPWMYIALVETLVVVVEAWIFVRLLRIPVWKAALVSLLANGLSFLVGLAVL